MPPCFTLNPLPEMREQSSSAIAPPPFLSARRLRIKKREKCSHSDSSKFREEITVVLVATTQPRMTLLPTATVLGVLRPLGTDVGRGKELSSCQDVFTLLFLFCFLFDIRVRDCVLLDDCVRAFVHVLQESTVFEAHLSVLSRPASSTSASTSERTGKVLAQNECASRDSVSFFLFPVRACLLLFSRRFCAMAKLWHRTLSCASIVNCL